MRRTTVFAIGSAVIAMTVLSVAAYGCSDDGGVVAGPLPPKVDSSPPVDTGLKGDTGADAGPGGPAPPPPTIGTQQIDRFGRPFVNTSLTGTFSPSSTSAVNKKNAYNADPDQASWIATYRVEIAANLAILDSIDGVCGNQIDTNPIGATNIEKYGKLADMLADDRQWLKTDGTTSNQYLAVELNASAIMPNTDRGGRGLAHDVIDVHYSTLMKGTPTGLGDGSNPIASKVNGTVFPFLSPPQ
jgi:hypothetical protein